MKTLPILLLFIPGLLRADSVDCHMIIGYAGYQGMIPQCFLDSAGQATIVLNGSSRLDWQNLRILPGTGLTSLTISSAGQPVAIVDHGTLTQIDGNLTSDSPLGLFTSNLHIGATGNVSAPRLLLSALPAANPDAWISSGSTVVTQAPGTPGTVVNQEIVRATAGNLTIIGTTVQNEGRGGGPATMQASGDLQLTAAGSVSVTNVAATGLSQPAAGISSINNFGTMRGFTVHLQSVPSYDPATVNLIQINITNGGIIRSSPSGSGVFVNTVHPNQLVTGYTSLLAGSQIITPNAAAWPTSTNVQSRLINDGEVLDPQEDEAPTAPAAPVAIPRLTGNGSAPQVVATGASAPPLAVTYSSLNALPKTSPIPIPLSTASSIATRGTPVAGSKKKGKPLIKGAFFQLGYRN